MKRHRININLHSILLILIGLIIVNVSFGENNSSLTEVDIEPLDGAKLYEEKTCFLCHGLDGKTPIAPIYPKIAGQELEYIRQQLKDIKSGARDNAQTAAMHGIMQLVTEEELEVIASHVASLDRGKIDQKPDRRSIGAKLFKRKTCFTCHGRKGQTPIMENYPKLAGQNAEYAVQQIKDIKSGVRNNGMAAAMNSVMFMVNDEEIDIIAKYIETLEP
jgi:cytochrome c553